MTPQEQLDKWRSEGFDHLYLDDDGKIKHRYAGRVVPCKWCGEPADFPGTFCNHCWEIDRLLNWHLSENTLHFIWEKVNELLLEKRRGVETDRAL